MAAVFNLYAIAIFCVGPVQPCRLIKKLPSTSLPPGKHNTHRLQHPMAPPGRAAPSASRQLHQQHVVYHQLSPLPSVAVLAPAPIAAAWPPATPLQLQTTLAPLKRCTRSSPTQQQWSRACSCASLPQQPAATAVARTAEDCGPTHTPSSGTAAAGLKAWVLQHSRTLPTQLSAAHDMELPGCVHFSVCCFASVALADCSPPAAQPVLAPRGLHAPCAVCALGSSFVPLAPGPPAKQTSRQVGPHWPSSW